MNRVLIDTGIVHVLDKMLSNNCQTLLLGKNGKTENIIFSHGVILWLLWRSVMVRSCHSGKTMENNWCNRGALNGMVVIWRDVRVAFIAAVREFHSRARRRSNQERKQESSRHPKTLLRRFESLQVQLPSVSVKLPSFLLCRLLLFTLCVRVCVILLQICADCTQQGGLFLSLKSPEGPSSIFFRGTVWNCAHSWRRTLPQSALCCVARRLSSCETHPTSLPTENNFRIWGRKGEKTHTQKRKWRQQLFCF